jgi:hypothetical protein
MPNFYLLRQDNSYSDFATYPIQPADRPEGEWVQGTPIALEPFKPITLAEQLNDFFTANLPDEAQADFAPLKVSVRQAMEENRPHIARLIIERADIPTELEALRTQILTLFPEA